MALAEYAHQAALLLDSTGTIRAATAAAAALFERKASDLTGVPFGMVPPGQSEIQVDLVNPGGRSRIVVARSVASDSARDWTIVLLAEQWPLLFECAAQAALADLAPLLAEHRLALAVSPWPFTKTHPSTRGLLAGAVRRLIERAAPQQGTLIVYAHLASAEWITIGLVLFGGASAGRAIAGDFDEFAEQVRAADGLLQLDSCTSGCGLQLILPSGSPAAASRMSAHRPAGSVRSEP